MTDPVRVLLAAARRHPDPFLNALWLGALAATANRHPAFLDGELAELAERCLAIWPPQAKA